MMAIISRYWRDYFGIVACSLTAIGLIGAPAYMMAGAFFAIRGQWAECAACAIPIVVGLCAMGYLAYEEDRLERMRSPRGGDR